MSSSLTLKIGSVVHGIVKTLTRGVNSIANKIYSRKVDIFI